MNKIKGKLIAAFGIPGSGKSSTTKEIGKILNIRTFHEPEESQWGEAVTLRSIVGNFTALMWFRSTRIPQFILASKLKELGNNVMLDSCYDKLFYLYYNKEGMDWLFSKDDLYYEEMIGIAKKDYDNLPDIDIIIFFLQTEKNWREFIRIRNRDLDNDIEFNNSFVLQEALLEVAKQYTDAKNCRLIIHEQSFSDPQTEALKIVQIIKQYL